MKNALMETQDFIEKLEKLNFIKVKDKALISEEGFELTYHTKFQTLMGSRENCSFFGLPIQLIFRVEKDGQYVQSWGCMELEDTTQMAKWYKIKHSDLQNAEDERERKVRKANELIWENI